MPSKPPETETRVDPVLALIKTASVATETTRENLQTAIRECDESLIGMVAVTIKAAHVLADLLTQIKSAVRQDAEVTR